jgi:hypothetical protein
MLRAQLQQRRPGFYTRWAQKYGSINAVAPDGRSVDDAWNRMTEQAFRNNQARGKPKGKARTKGKNPFEGFSIVGDGN